MSETSDPIGDALRADAELARGEVRAAGMICPSCGANAADLIPSRGRDPYRHSLALTDGPTPQAMDAECRDGQRVTLAAFEQFQDAASIAMLDDFWRRQDEAFERIVGTPDPGRGFPGLLGLL